MKRLDKYLTVVAAVTVLSAVAMSASAESDLFTKLDANVDGMTSLSEAKAHEALIENFKVVDDNKKVQHLISTSVSSIICPCIQFTLGILKE